MNIQKMIHARDRLATEIEYRVGQFLRRLDACGEFAPSVTRKFGGGHDSVETITIDTAGNVVLYCSNCYRESVDKYTVSYPSYLIDSLDEAGIKAFADDARRLRDEAKASEAKAQAEREREAELKTLASLTAKYTPVAKTGE